MGEQAVLPCVACMMVTEENGNVEGAVLGRAVVKLSPLCMLPLPRGGGEVGTQSPRPLLGPLVLGRGRADELRLLLPRMLLLDPRRRW